MYRLWPDPDPTPLDEDALTALYTPTDRGRPWLRANFVSSLDGAATLAGFSEGLSNPDDKRVFGLLRMLCDALVVGAGTLRNEGYRAVRLSPERRRWRLAHGLAEYPTLVVVSARLALDPAQPALADAPVRPIIVTHPDADPGPLRKVADVIAFGSGAEAVDPHGAIDPQDAVDLRGAMGELHARGLRQILSEGGPRLFGSLTAADLVDELCLTVSPLLTGPGAGRITDGPLVAAPRRLALRHVLSASNMLLLRYSRYSR